MTHKMGRHVRQWTFSFILSLVALSLTPFLVQRFSLSPPWSNCPSRFYPQMKSFYIDWEFVSHVNMLQSGTLGPSQQVLDTIWEIGWLSSETHQVIWPRNSGVALDRMAPVLQFLTDYNRPKVHFNCYFTLYDGWRERTGPRKSAQYRRIHTNQLRENFIGIGSYGEPGRFIHLFPDSDLFPILDHPVMAFDRHVYDNSVILIPDIYFLQSKGYVDLRREIDNADVLWNAKVSKMVWRGSNHGDGYEVYNTHINKNKLLNQRELLMREISINSWLASYINASLLPHAPEPNLLLSKTDMLKFKFQLDIDGRTNSWDGLFWKLYSNSVVFKVASHYEQWYYKHLKPMEHYIPVKGDLSDLGEKLNWALEHDEKCRLIADQGKKIAKGLTNVITQGEFRQPEL